MRGWCGSASFVRAFVLSILLSFCGLLGGCQRPLGVDSEPNTGFQCVAMQPGSSVPVSTRFGSLPAKYQLTQYQGPEGQVLYTAEVPVRFYPAVDSQGDPNLVAEVWAKTTQCLQTVEPWLIGPRGERLRIVLQDAATHGANDARRIRVTRSPFIQGHSEFWTTQWGCHQIFHEVLHLVGLVDAYADAANSCRAQGPADAVTVAPDRAFARVGLSVAGSFAPSFGGPTDSLLYPSEFVAITSPHCSESRLYGQCAANAYRSHRSPGGGCQPAPQECANAQSWYSSPGTL
jgi:hypothetical protein